MSKATLVVVALLLAACGPSEPLNVVGIQTGKSLNSDHSVGTHAATFHPNDPMYVSVLNVGRGKGTITVKWTFAGRVLQTLTKKVSYNGQAGPMTESDLLAYACQRTRPGHEVEVVVLRDGDRLTLKLPLQ